MDNGAQNTPSIRRQPRIVIIGAGMGGLTLSASLRQRGIESAVYEQTPAFARIGAGIQMGPNAVKVLRSLGLEEAVARVSYAPPSLDNRDWDTGISTFELPLGELSRERYGAPYYLLHRADLHEALASIVPDETIHLGHQLVDIRLSDGGPTTLTFANGASVEADVVVAADGVHSLVREKLFPHRDPVFTGKVAYRTVFDATLAGENQPSLPSTKWWGPDRHIVIYYVSAGKEIYFTTSIPDPDWKTESWSAEGSVEELRQELVGFHPEVQGILAATPSVHKWAIYDRDPMESWHLGNVVLLGDACHPMTPFMAQGAASAMEDATILARLLSERGFGALEETFELYEAIRKPRTSRIQLSSRGNEWLRQATDPTWVYGYDSTTAPLVPTESEVAAAVAGQEV